MKKSIPTLPLMKNKLNTYENGIVALMALVMGCLFFDRLSLTFLIPFVAKDLHLNDTQIGLLAGALSLAWAFSSYYSTAWAERNNRKKVVFVVAVFIFSLCSVGSGLAVSFGTLLQARFVMGFSEGAVIPLAQSFVERESTPSRLGFNSGILQAVGSGLFGSIIGPVVLVKLAENMGWRNAFFIAGIPGLLLGLLAWFAVKKSTAERIPQQRRALPSENDSNPKSPQVPLSFRELIRFNNIRYGIGLSCCVFGWWFATLPFISKYFVEVQGMSPDAMGKTMGLLGVSGVLSGIIVPALSDRLGRKPVLLAFVALGVFYPVAVQFLNGSALHLPLMFLTYFMMGCLALVAAVIPSEAAPAASRAKTMGLMMGIGEIVGGVLVPAVAGILSDQIDPSAFLWVSSAMAVFGLFFVARLQETAPAILSETKHSS